MTGDVSKSESVCFELCLCFLCFDSYPKFRAFLNFLYLLIITLALPPISILLFKEALSPTEVPTMIWNDQVPENIAYVHRIGLKCLKDSKSLYGFRHLPLLSREKRESHYREIMSATEKYRIQGQYCWRDYCGPWLEDHWLATFCCNRSIDDFGPFIPLLIPWQYFFWRNNTYNQENYRKFLNEILALIKPEFFYITVEGNDWGVEGLINETYLPGFPDNILIIHPGGRGHIPCLWHKAAHNPTDVVEMKYKAVFMGTPHFQRNLILSHFANHFKDKFYQGMSRNWTEYYKRSMVILSPRGYSRGCFRTAEILEMGLIPVLIFSQKQWIPYWKSNLNWTNVGFIGTTSHISSLIKEIDALTEERAAEMRRYIRAHHDTHFSPQGTMHQISLFMTSGFRESDLRCSEYLHSF